MAWETLSRRENMRYLKEMDEKGSFGKLAASVYMELREKFLEQYNSNGYFDLIQDVKGAFNPMAAELANEMIDAMQRSLISF